MEYLKLKNLIDESLTFKDFDWLQNRSGFDIPTDVYEGNTYIGTIQSDRSGNHYEIKLIDTPSGKITIKSNKQNQFKSKKEAGERLLRTWQMIRTQGLHI